MLMSHRLRFTLALIMAVVLATGLLYVSFSGSSEARQPSEMGTAVVGNDYQVAGVVAKGSLTRKGGEIKFKIRDYSGKATVQVTYTGEVPDPFKEGREVIVTVKKQNGVWVGTPGTLATKCPSKFKSERPAKETK